MASAVVLAGFSMVLVRAVMAAIVATAPPFSSAPNGVLTGARLPSASRACVDSCAAAWDAFAPVLGSCRRLGRREERHARTWWPSILRPVCCCNSERTSNNGPLGLGASVTWSRSSWRR
ncbi:hypothetical protein PF005_g19837 [Phytophthora fragariae]|uniref:Secreted protein n=2 Tax=Phytophthora fragariae TaxID=53985 RepID=A0A6A3RXV3_9STRA|nr:hypothetical protein PF009_g22058 [Phytophthora fragariae]KAE9085743.1 hypothetical protein PF010_g20349 [Phytophthora fragariae]KAE9105687.1 hypothetical protein PF006_g21558 [Phytophthora fragariae]KAE9188977.1 hypothetical protein PF005_g19837 [Phytophthora fragariae]